MIHFHICQKYCTLSFNNITPKRFLLRICIHTECTFLVKLSTWATHVSSRLYSSSFYCSYTQPHHPLQNLSPHEDSLKPLYYMQLRTAPCYPCCRVWTTFIHSNFCTTEFDIFDKHKAVAPYTLQLLRITPAPQIQRPCMAWQPLIQSHLTKFILEAISSSRERPWFVACVAILANVSITTLKPLAFTPTICMFHLFLVV